MFKVREIDTIGADVRKEEFVGLLSEARINTFILYSFTVHFAITHIKNQLMHN
jgi:hypothetical protein